MSVTLQGGSTCQSKRSARCPRTIQLVKNVRLEGFLCHWGILKKVSFSSYPRERLVSISVRLGSQQQWLYGAESKNWSEVSGLTGGRGITGFRIKRKWICTKVESSANELLPDMLFVYVCIIACKPAAELEMESAACLVFTCWLINHHVICSVLLLVTKLTSTTCMCVHVNYRNESLLTAFTRPGSFTAN